MFDLILQAMYSGLLAGGSYALVALGLALVFGTMRVINLAHGEFVLLAAYVAYTAESRLGWNPLLALPVSIVVVCLTAVGVYGLVRRVEKNREMNSLILTFGLGVILTNLVLFVWKADIHSTSVGWFQEPVVVGPLFSTRAELLFGVTSVVWVALLWLWLTRSWYGRAVRAVSSNRDAARLVGIDPHATELASFVVAGILASFAGVAIYCASVVQPALGNALTIKAFIVTILAGIGSIPGVLVGAVLLGVGEALTITLLSSALQELTAMVLLLVVLLVLPNGLFGRAGRRA